MYPQSIQVIEEKLKNLSQQSFLRQQVVKETLFQYNEAIIDLDKNEATIRGLEKELATINGSVNNKSTCDTMINQIVATEAMADVERLRHMLRECDALQDKIKAGFKN